MNYRITIEKIETKKVTESTYYPDVKNKSGTMGAYADTAIDKEVSEVIYEQKIDKVIDLMAVINAFNK